MTVINTNSAKIDRFTIVTAINLALLLLIIALEELVAERWWWTTFLTYMPQHVMLAPSLALLVAALARRRCVPALLGGVAALACSLALLGVNIPTGATMPAEPPIRVMTWNIHHLSGAMRAYLRDTADIRLRQTALLLDITRDTERAVIAGDFNTPPRGRAYRLITRHCQDAFRAGGWGAGYTYPARLPVMKIDHIFTSRDIAVTRCQTICTNASDHLPLIADMGIIPPSAATRARN